MLVQPRDWLRDPEVVRIVRALKIVKVSACWFFSLSFHTWLRSRVASFIPFCHLSTDSWRRTLCLKVFRIMRLKTILFRLEEVRASVKDWDHLMRTYFESGEQELIFRQLWAWANHVYFDNRIALWLSKVHFVFWKCNPSGNHEQMTSRWFP